jgi:hypothetical protein
MRTVRGGEGVVDVEVAERREPLDGLGRVLLLARIEAGILEDADLAVAILPRSLPPAMPYR